MGTKLKKVIVVFSAACMLNALAAGCSFAPAPKPETDNVGDVLAEELNSTLPTNDAETIAGTEKPQEAADGKWHVLDSETAAAIDADFVGEVWHIAEGAFSIVETKMQILDDGSLASSSPSSNAEIPDSLLIHVVVDDDTYFYTRTVYGNGESHEDAEAGFQDLKEHVSVEMRGVFENDVFYASEVRIIKIS